MSLFPTLRYRDASAAVAFLTGVLGFREGATSRHDDGTVEHAELWCGDPPGAVLLGQLREGDAFATGRAVLHVADADPDARHAAAVAAGADVVMGLTDQPHGSRELALVDPEGDLWTAGTYRPQAP